MPNGLSPTRSLIQRMSLSSSSGVELLEPSTPMAPALLAAAITSLVWAKATIGNSAPYSSHSRVRSGSPAMAHLPWWYRDGEPAGARRAPGMRTRVRFTGHASITMQYTHTAYPRPQGGLRLPSPRPDGGEEQRVASIGRRVLGSTGIEVAELGLGAMDTPTSKEGPGHFQGRARPSGSTSSTRRANTRAPSS